jgi:hypothetical protein
MKRLALALMGGALLFGCTDTSEPPADSGPNAGDGRTGDALVIDDARGLECKVDEDQDGDGIPNGEEGCLYGLDSDGDGTPNWQDFDSDNDGVADQVEAGIKGQCKGKDKDSWPCDTDGDGVEDYVDVDSDGDQLLDGEEDANGDGLLGCCIVACGKPSEQQKNECILNADGCGPGQTCGKDGKCTPSADFKCSNGELSPHSRDTFNDGRFDNQRGTFVCRDATEDRPQGRKPLQLIKSPKPLDPSTPAAGGDPYAGDWHLALELTGQYRKLALANAKELEAAAVIDYTDPQTELMAGFVVTLPVPASQTQVDLSQELRDISSKLQNSLPGGASDIAERTSGSKGRSHDEYIQITNAIFDLSGTNTDVSTARNEVIAGLLGRSPGTLGTLPSPYGGYATEMVLKLAIIYRYPFKVKPGTSRDFERDSDGYPIYDDSKAAERQIVLIGGLAARSNVTDPARNTGFLQDDLAGATVIARYQTKTNNECDVGTLTSLPVADIIWVIDESGSMSGERENVKNNANNFFSRALASGLDFRMCVTGMMAPNGQHAQHIGKCGSKCNASPDSDPGGPDEFLGPTKGVFQLRQ